MADEKPNHKQRVCDLAREFFANYTASIGAKSSEQIGIQAFKNAELFIAIEAKYLTGTLEVVTKEQWGSDCTAPKLDPLHPINLISTEWNEKKKGANRELVNRISKVLVSNPEPDYAYADEAGMRWSPDTTRVARTLFREYADKGIFHVKGV